MERQNMLAKNEKYLLSFYRDMNFRWGKTSYTECCTKKEKSGLIWLLAVVWKLRRIRLIKEDSVYVYVKRISNAYC
jgi:hypothetical protein